MVKESMEDVRARVEARAKDVYYGRTLRKSFARYQEILEMPNLLEVQKKSYQWFLDTGLREVFKDVAAITDYAGNLELSFIDYSMDLNSYARYYWSFKYRDQVFPVYLIHCHIVLALYPHPGSPRRHRGRRCRSRRRCF